MGSLPDVKSKYTYANMVSTTSLKLSANTSSSTLTRTPRSIAIPNLIIKSKCNGSAHRFSFMSIVLPCHDIPLRAEVTQKPPRRTLHYEHLDPDVEAELAALLVHEIEF